MTQNRVSRTLRDWLGTVADSDAGITWLINVPAGPALLDEMPAGIGYIIITSCCDQARLWRTAGYRICGDCDEAYAYYGAPHTVVLRTEKQSAAARAMFATALGFLSSHGRIMAYAPNDAGGRQLPGYAEALGLAYSKDARHRCTFITARCDGDGLDDQALKAMLAEGDYQRMEDGYYTCPGLHSWQKPDTGSAMLARYLPEDMPGNGADFGCGWGYLSCRLVPAMEAGARLYCLDNDKRALKAAAMNLEQRTDDTNINWQTLWRDIRHPHDMPKTLDWIAMNPPFHNGIGEGDIDLGRAFIAAAAESLRKGGRLYMVANRKLAYEEDLSRLFKHVEKRAEENGYKIFETRK